MAAILMGTLSAFLSEAAARGFAWGQHDCMLFVADWARRLTGNDPGARWRGTYSTQAEAEAILSRGGGPGPILHEALTAQGWVPVVSDLKPGDIAVVRVPAFAGHALVASVFAGRGRFALVTERGLVVAPAPLMLGWRHPNG
jgi:hypothetical protein